MVDYHKKKLDNSLNFEKKIRWEIDIKDEKISYQANPRSGWSLDSI